MALFYKRNIHLDYEMRAGRHEWNKSNLRYFLGRTTLHRFRHICGIFYLVFNQTLSLFLSKYNTPLTQYKSDISLHVIVNAN